MDLNNGAFQQGGGNGGAGGSAAPFLSPIVVPWTDSRGAQNWVTSTNVPAPLARGWLVWLETLGQRVRVDHTYSQAKSGDSISQLLARITGDVVNDYGIRPSQVPPGPWINLIGTNTGNAYSAATSGPINAYVDQMLSDLGKILDWQVARGAEIYQIAEWPRGDSVGGTALLSADAVKVMYAYAEGIRGIRRKGVEVVDVQPRMADPAKTDYTPLAGILNNDFLHNAPGAGFITGDALNHRMTLTSRLPKLSLLPSSNGDQYEAVARPKGCLNTNPMLVQGAGGTLGTNATGACPEGYTLSASAGLSVVGSFVTTTLPDGTKRPAFRMTVSGTPTSANGTALLRQSGLIGKLNAGDTIESVYETLVADGHVNFAAPGQMLDTGVSASRLHGGLSITNDTQMAASAVKGFYGVPRSAKGKFDVLPASLSFQFGPYFTLAGVASNLVMDFLSAKAGKV